MIQVFTTSFIRTDIPQSRGQASRIEYHQAGIDTPSLDAVDGHPMPLWLHFLGHLASPAPRALLLVGGERTPTPLTHRPQTQTPQTPPPHLTPPTVRPSFSSARHRLSAMCASPLLRACCFVLQRMHAVLRIPKLLLISAQFA